MTQRDPPLRKGLIDARRCASGGLELTLLDDSRVEVGVRDGDVIATATRSFQRNATWKLFFTRYRFASDWEQFARQIIS